MSEDAVERWHPRHMEWIKEQSKRRPTLSWKLKNSAAIRDKIDHAGDLEDALRDAMQALEASQQENERLRRLLEYAGGILAHGTPGSAWMDWLMRAQGVLGLSFHESRYRDGHSIPFSELRERVKDLPRVHVADLEEQEASDEQ